MTSYVRLLAAAAMVYSHIIRSHRRRALGVLLFLASRSETASTDRQLAILWLRRDAATAFAHRGCIRISTHRSLLVHLGEPRTATVRVPGSAQLLLGERPMPFFDLRIRRAESSDFDPKSDDLGHRILNQILSRPIMQKYRTA